jgi:hypothetical protein
MADCDLCGHPLGSTGVCPNREKGEGGHPPKPTESKQRRMSQDDYILVLFNDLEFSEKGRCSYLTSEYGKPYIDELKSTQKHFLIDRLKQMKEDRKQ